MKLTHIIPAIAVMLVSSLPFSANAATDTDKAPAPVAQTGTPAKMKPHSHMQEKMGMPANAAERGMDMKPGADKSKHLHPRDGK